ncbi:MAG: hypothetical protein ABW026_06440 [Microvirga sp.]
MNDAQKAFALDLIMGRIRDHLEQVEGILKDRPTPFLLGQKSVLTAYSVLWNQIRAATKV